MQNQTIKLDKALYGYYFNFTGYRWPCDLVVDAGRLWGSLSLVDLGWIALATCLLIKGRHVFERHVARRLMIQTGLMDRADNELRLKVHESTWKFTLHTSFFLLCVASYWIDCPPDCSPLQRPYDCLWRGMSTLTRMPRSPSNLMLTLLSNFQQAVRLEERKSEWVGRPISRLLSSKEFSIILLGIC